MGRVLQTKREVALALAVWLVPSLALAAPAPGAVVRVEIDVSAIEAFDAGGIERSVRAQTEKILGDEGWFMDDAAKDSIVVRVEYVDKEDLEYGIHVHAYDDGAEIETGQEWFVCKYCSHALVGQRYAERLPEVLRRLAEANRKAEEGAAQSEPGAGESTHEEEPETTSEPSGSEPGPGRERSMVLRNAGLAMLIPGGAALGTGLGFVIAGKREVDREAPDRISERNYRPPGTAVTVIGAVAVSTGVGLLVVHALRNRRARQTDTRVTVSPVFGPQLGVVLRGRF